MNVREPRHPILITGEPGAGKTWLADQLVRLLPPTWHIGQRRLDQVDDGARLPAIDRSRTGTSPYRASGTARARLHSFLHDDDVDGKRWLLVIDDAHRGSPVVWDEIRAIVNQSGRRGGFAAIVVLGDTELVRSDRRPRIRAASRPPFAFIFTCRHSMSTKHASCSNSWGRTTSRVIGSFEELHRDARGNASALLCLAQTRRRNAFAAFARPERRDDLVNWPKPVGPPVRISPGRRSNQKNSRARSRSPLRRWRQLVRQVFDRMSPLLVPAKPPIRVEEGLVEVGWDGDLETEFAESAETAE